MKPTTNGLFASQSSPSFTSPRFRGHLPIIFTHQRKKNLANFVTLSLPSDDSSSRVTSSRRAILVAPPLLAAAISLWPSVSSAAADIVADTLSEPAAPPPPLPPPPVEEEITSRIYDATALGEPMAVGKDKKRVWEKLLNARIVYLGEAEQVPTRDDKELELEIVRNLRKRCVESERQLSLALEAFPVDLQDQLNQYMDKSLNLCLKRRAPFPPWRKSHSGDSSIAMHLLSEGMVPKACAIERLCPRRGDKSDEKARHRDFRRLKHYFDRTLKTSWNSIT